MCLLAQVLDMDPADVVLRLTRLKLVLPDCDVARMVELQPRYATDYAASPIERNWAATTFCKAFETLCSVCYLLSYSFSC